MNDPTAPRLRNAAFNANAMSGGWLQITLILRPEGVLIEGRASATRNAPVTSYVQVLTWEDILFNKIDPLDMALQDVRNKLRKEL
jgi:hypothetical protein